jgi:hypothetical protein
MFDCLRANRSGKLGLSGIGFVQTISLPDP